MAKKSKKKVRNNIIVGVLVVILLLFIGNQAGFLSIVSEQEVEYIYQYTGGTEISVCENQANYFITQKGGANLLANTVEINTGYSTFKFIATEIEDHALDDYPCNLAYHLMVDVYKDENKIDTIYSYVKGGTDGELCSNSQPNIPYKFCDNVNNCVTLLEMQKLASSFRDIQNGYINGWRVGYKVEYSENLIDINVSSSLKSSLVAGENITTEIIINNKLQQTLHGVLDIDFSTTTLIGDKLLSVSKDVVLSPGINTINYDLPSTKSINELKVEPTLTLKVLGDKFTNLNVIRNPAYVYRVDCIDTGYEPSIRSSKVYGIISTTELNIFKITDSQIISVAPNPLYLNKTGDVCPSGYILNGEKTYCIRDDIKDLTCTIVGCPEIEGHDYQCTSAGICAETVFVSKKCELDTDCPEDTLCDVETGLCIQSKIYEDLVKVKCLTDNDCPLDYNCENSGLCSKDNSTIMLQCIKSSDCMIPCEGVNAVCNQFGQCIYGGDCTKVDYGCIQTGCLKDYRCNKETNACEEIPTINVGSLELKWYEFVLSISFILLVAFYFVMRYRKKINFK